MLLLRFGSKNVGADTLTEELRELVDDAAVLANVLSREEMSSVTLSSLSEAKIVPFTLVGGIFIQFRLFIGMFGFGLGFDAARWAPPGGGGAPGGGGGPRPGGGGGGGGPPPRLAAAGGGGGAGGPLAALADVGGVAVDPSVGLIPMVAEPGVETAVGGVVDGLGGAASTLSSSCGGSGGAAPGALPLFPAARYRIVLFKYCNWAL